MYVCILRWMVRFILAGQKWQIVIVLPEDDLVLIIDYFINNGKATDRANII